VTEAALTAGIAAFLESASVEDTVSWLRKRASGIDSLFPLDAKAGEDPERVLIALVRDLGLRHPATERLGLALLRVLTKHTEDKELTQLALRLCQRQFLPYTSRWFLAELSRLTRAGKPSRHDVEIALAAIIQAPPLVAGAREYWVLLLKVPIFSTIALNALNQGWHDALRYLPDWWSAAPPKTRDIELRQLIASIVRENGANVALPEISRVGSSWPQPLRDAVDRALATNSLQRIFRRGDRTMGLCSAIDGAGRIPGIVLEAES
jgi:hypothetical protein